MISNTIEKYWEGDLKSVFSNERCISLVQSTGGPTELVRSRYTKINKSILISDQM